MIKINKTVEQSFYIPAILLGLVLFTAVASIVFTNVRYVKWKPIFSMREENLGNPYRVVATFIRCVSEIILGAK